jgi:hypothetical protein
MEISAKFPAIEALDSHDHAVLLGSVTEPVSQTNLEEHVVATVQVLGVGNLNDWNKAGLGDPLSYTKQGSFIWREAMGRREETRRRRGREEGEGTKEIKGRGSLMNAGGVLSEEAFSHEIVPGREEEEGAIREGK